MTRHATKFLAGIVVLAAAAAHAESDWFGLGDGHDGPATIGAADTVVNVYATLATDVAAGATTVELTDAGGFADGDLVLLWQPAGYPVPTSGDPTPIDLTTLATGRWEFTRVVDVTGDTLTLRGAMVAAFPAAYTQAVLVPEYTTLTIAAGASIAAEPWDGAVGGIAVFLVQGDLQLDGTIGATAAGSRGGVFVSGPGTYGCTDLDEPSPLGGMKGESIAADAYPAATGRGNVANGGGGGICHNSGGAGGGHGGAGGEGGRNWRDDPDTTLPAGVIGGRPVGGMGGARVLHSLLDRLVPGGGGGSGQGNNDIGTSGGSGGGVVFFRAGALLGAGRIEANGGDAGTSGIDSAGGGGAGGSVLIRVAGAADCVAIEARGGNGGNAGDYHGPGGGGGGGIILLQAASATCPADVSAGAAGTQNVVDAADGPTYGATPGEAGTQETPPTGGYDDDQDDDGVPDVVEDGADTDGDTTPDYLDTDDDGDGILTRDERPGDVDVDSDGDTTPDYLDPDDDGDGILTRDERPGGADQDTDGDGHPNHLDPDDDGDTVPTRDERPGDEDQDTDGDGHPNHLDPDDDDDGIPTATEVADETALGGEPDTDGVPAYLDQDSDGDGAPDAFEGTGDEDGDGIPNYLDPDSAPTDTDTDGDTVLDRVECPGGPPGCRDTDDDTTPDWLDVDDDGDTVPTRDERPGETDRDTDDDTTPDYLDPDDDGDGIPTLTERTDEAELGGEPDDDGVPAYLDLDSDGDTLPDETEGTGDDDGDGVPNYLDPDEGPTPGDSDGDTVPDSVECPGGPPGCRDTDGDTTPDYLDTDDDGDTVPTRQERPGNTDRDTDGDTTPDYLDPDDDGDGIPTLTERTDVTELGGEPDDDGVPAYLDLDSDGDTVPDRTEGTGDDDGDGVPNYLDPLGDNELPPTAGMSGGALCAIGRTGAGGGFAALLLAGLIGVQVLRRRRRSTRDPFDGRCGNAPFAAQNDGPRVGLVSEPRPSGRGIAGCAARHDTPRAEARGSDSDGRRTFGAVPGGGLPVLLLAAATLLLAAPRVSAQSVTLDQYRAAETAEDGFALSRPDDLGHLRWGVRLDFDYALNPLVVEGVEGDPDSERGAIVEHMLVAQLVGALGLIDRLVVFVGLPVNLMMVGQEFPGFPAADGTSLGDLFLGLRARIVGERGDLFALGAQVTLTTPTAAAAQDGELLAGEGSLSGWLKILAELRWDFLRVTANVGARFRKDADFRSVAVSHSLAVSHEFTWALGLTIPAVRDRLDVYAEAYGATTFDSFADREVSPVELIAGLKVWAVDGLNVGLAAGPGLARGYGAPDLRFILTFAYAVPVEQPTGAAGRKDSDDDGLYDDEDDCPDDPEDFDEFQDGDGCPDPDNDGDTIVDDDDSCPLVAEDLDGFDDEDGCPDLDNDNDTVPDEIDNCPLEAEDDDDYEDEDGCPDPDNDADTVLDRDDNCPLDPGRPEEQGCPRTIVVDRGVGEIRILERVEFETNEDIVLDRSIPVLEEVRGALASNVAIRRVRVEGHTDDRGSDEHNMDLSRRRAQAVVRWLTEHGLPAPRLEAWGCGETVPVESNATSTGRQTNRRVEFHIVDPGAPGAAGPEATCQRAE